MWEQTKTRTARGATLLALALLAISDFAGAQSGSAVPQPSAAEFSIPLLSPEQMTADDQAAAQRQQQTIAQSAQFYGYTLDSSYAYREIACPVAPNHLLLAYEATSPNGSVSRFTAVVLRGVEEKTSARHPVAQIIPILHFGVVPFGPAIANPHSIEVFNSGVANAPSATEVLAATQAGNQPLLVRALCYLAMVGEEPAALRSPGLEQATIHAPVPALVFQDRGKIRQMISIRSAPSSYQVWALTFQSGGKLLSAVRTEHPIDRTPLVLNAANTGSPVEPTSPTTPTTANSAPSQVFAEPATSTPVTPEPATSAPAAPTAARVEPAAAAPTHAPPVAPALTSPSVTAEAAKHPVPPTPPPAAATPTAAAPPGSTPAPASANAEVPQPPSPPSPAENTAPVTEPVTAPVSSPVAPAVEPIPPAAPPVAPANPPHPPSAGPTPAASAVAQPPVTPAAPAPAAIPAAPIPAATAMAMLPIVKPSPPPPPGRFVPNPPPPPSRFIPDSALKTPPHLPQ